MTAPAGRAAGVDGDRLLDRLADLAGVGGGPGGVTRLAWSVELAAAVDLVSSWASAAGARVGVDGVGNLVAELPGADPGRPPLVTGSHLDTVVGAGHLDGAYGVVGGIEVLDAVARSGGLRHPLRVVGYANEEGVVAAPFTGARAIAGTLPASELTAVGPDGTTLADRLAAAGLLGDWRRAAWDRVAATVELHVEQGPRLDGDGVDIGVVTAITGQRRGVVVVTGEANHAGTTPMGARRDALVAAASLVLEVRALAGPGGAEVATVGRLRAEPGVGNVIAGTAELTYDLRAVDDARADAAEAELAVRAAAVADGSGCRVEVRRLSATAAVPTDAAVRAATCASADALGLSWAEMPSGAGHDCAHLSALGPIGMVFVPSTGGVSHHHRESTPPAALVAGAGVLLGTLRRLDRELP